MLQRILLTTVATGLLIAPALAAPPSKSALTQPVSVQFKNEDVRNVLKMIGQFTGVPVTIADDVEGKVTTHLNQVAATNCLRVVARAVDAVVVPDGKSGLLVSKPLAPVSGGTVTEGPKVSLEFDKASLPTFVNAVAQFANVNLIYNSDALRGTVTIKTDQEPWQKVLERGLGKGYRLIDEGGLFRIEAK